MKPINKQTMNNKMLQLLHPHAGDIPYIYIDAPKYEEDFNYWMHK